MTKSDMVHRIRYGKIIIRASITLAAGGLTFVITNLQSPDPHLLWILTISVLISGVTLLAQFLYDFENRLENVEDKQDIRSTEMHSLVEDQSAKIQSLLNDGFARMNEAAELFQAVEASALQTDAVTQLVRHSTQIKPDAEPLVRELAQAQISRTSQFLKELSEGGQISYDGEDRDWILELTRQSRNTIDATSLSTVDAGSTGFEGGLWASHLGALYLELQREATKRGVVIRRLFILDSPGQSRPADLLRICRRQQELGIDARVLDRSTIPRDLEKLLFDFIVFDGVISYEVTPAARVGDNGRPTIVKTSLTLRPERVEERMRRFEDLWVSAQQFE